MTSEIYKFGGLLFHAFDNADQVRSFDSLRIDQIRNIGSLSSFLKKISHRYLLVLNAEEEIQLTCFAILRLIQIAGDSQAGIVYSDYFLNNEKELIFCPLIDYQPGSLRDDFNFGHVLLFSAAAAKSALQKYGGLHPDAKGSFYDLRLKISIDNPIIHIPEPLYTVVEKNRKQAKKDQAIQEKHFAYVAAENLRRQKIMEKIATTYLILIGACLKTRTKKAPEDREIYPVTASVIIPVRNREKTITAAINSVLNQKVGFDYNIIVVDNHSSDGTTKIIKKLAAAHPEIKHIIPRSFDLSIGGCWNEAINSPWCGRFAVQLDSDDLYSSHHTLQSIVDMLQKGKYAMVVGSYTIVDEKLKKIPPGLIDHREWTKANGHNNALRINGLGAPRAFNTSVLRQLGFPNVGYGEDYAVALRISREYQIGRIYQSLYLCRRWKNNTDAALSAEKQNRNDFYKDKLRTLEIAARQIFNKKEA